MKSCLYYQTNKSCFSKNSISTSGLMSRAAKKTVMVIYGVMFTEHCDFTLRTEAIACIDNEPLAQYVN